MDFEALTDPTLLDRIEAGEKAKQITVTDRSSHLVCWFHNNKLTVLDMDDIPY